MNDAQIIAISITILAVLAGSVFNNVRIGELDTSFNRHLDDMRYVLLAAMDSHLEDIDLRFEHRDSRFQPMDSGMNQRFGRLDSKLDTLISMIGRLDARVAKLGEHSS